MSVERVRGKLVCRHMRSRFLEFQSHSDGEMVARWSKGGVA